MNAEERILDVFEPGLWMKQADVRRLAAIDTSTCGVTLKRLAANGVLEFGRIARAKREHGRPIHIYKLAMRAAGPLLTQKPGQEPRSSAEGTSHA